MSKKLTIGIMGTNQIQHIIPILEKKYDVINLQKNWDEGSSKITKTIRYIKQIRKVDVLYNIYTGPTFWKKARIAKLFKKKVVSHWIGSDAREAEEGKTNFKKLSCVDKFVSCFLPLSEQLEKYGIKTSILPIIPLNLDFNICKMPATHRVLIYMPEGSEQYYGYNEISRVFPVFPKIEFVVVANNNKEMFSPYKNVDVRGYLKTKEMEQLYNEISIVLRIHINDGLSMSVLEGMAKGKRIIWNYQFPYCLPGATTEEIVASLKELTTNDPIPDIEGHNYIVNNYNEKTFMDEFDKIIADLQN